MWENVYHLRRRLELNTLVITIDHLLQCEEVLKAIITHVSFDRGIFSKYPNIIVLRLLEQSTYIYITFN